LDFFVDNSLVPRIFSLISFSLF